jgi:Rrf2 family protein
MQITRETDYAIRCVLYLSENTERIVMANEIAHEKAIPKTFLSKILQKLTRAMIVKSYRGVRGGFQLIKNPKDINVLDVIEAIEGPVAMNKCAVDKKLCGFSCTCAVHPIWVEIKKNVEGFLRRTNFAKLADIEGKA